RRWRRQRVCFGPAAASWCPGSRWIDDRGAAKDGTLAGDQSAELIGLDVNAEKLNALLQRDVLASNVSVRTKVAGPPNALRTTGLVRLDRGGSLTLDGTVDLSQRDLPGYDLTAKLVDVDTSKLLVQGATKVPSAQLDALSLTVKGKGTTRDKANAQVGLTAGPIRVGKVAIDRVTLRARYAKGTLRIESLEIESLGQKASLDGELLLAKKRVKAKVQVVGDVGETLDRLREAGVPVTARVPVGAVRLRDGNVVARVEGPLDGVLRASVDVNRLGLAGGAVSLHADADLRRKEPGADGKRLELLSQSAHLELHGVRIERLLALRGKRLDGYTGTVSGRVDTEGTVDNPLVRFGIRARANAVDARGDGAPKLAVALDGTASKSVLDVRVKAERHRGILHAELMSGSVRLPLVVNEERKDIALHRPMRAKVAVQGGLSQFTSILNQDRFGDGPVPPAKVELDLDLAGTPARPTGTIRLEADGRVSLEAAQRVRLEGQLRPDGQRSIFTANTRAWLDTKQPPSVTSTASVRLSSSPFVPGYRTAEWSAKVDVRPHDLDSLPFPVDALRDVKGAIEAHLDLSGNRNDVLGQVALSLANMRRTAAEDDKAIGPFDAAVTVAIGKDRTKLNADVDIATGRALSLDGSVGLSGSGLIASVKAGAHRNAPLDLSLRVPRQALSNLSVFRRKLAGYEGQISGRVNVAGVVSKPTAAGDVVVDRFGTLAGTAGKVAVRLDAGEERIAAQVGLGMPQGGTPPVTVDLELIRDALRGYRSGKGVLPVRAVAHASNVELARIIPAKVAKGHELDLTGLLNWDMRAVVALRKPAASKEPSPIDRGRVDGTLTVTGGGVSIPGTERRYRDVELKVVSDAMSLRVEHLSARESDLANPNRRIGLSARVAWKDLRPSHAKLSLNAEDWLVFGGGPVGPADAPRGTLSIDAKVDADLTRPVRVVDVNVRALELLVPQRFPKAHEPEQMHLGDVIFLDETDLPPGKLPISEREKPEDKEDGADPDAGESADAPRDEAPEE
ncbi:MAG: hypothetical protein ACOC1F_09340, partial [Myxococcota bacterium]